MGKPKKNAIRIGENRWIEWVSIDNHQSSAIQVDDLIDPMDDFWSGLETECIHECCGIDAFDLLPDNIKHVAMRLSDPMLSDKFVRLRERVETSNEQVFVSSRLNNYFHREVLLPLIDHILANIPA